jgi:hypothetical protein
MKKIIVDSPSDDFLHGDAGNNMAEIWLDGMCFFPDFFERELVESVW